MKKYNLQVLNELQQLSALELPESLVELAKFDNKHRQNYADSFYISNDNDFEDWADECTEEQIKEYTSSLLGFACADGTGSTYALWLYKGITDLEDAPIVCYGSEGQLNVVAENLRQLIKMLSFGAENLHGEGFYHYFDDDDMEDEDFVYLTDFIKYKPSFLLFRKWMKETLDIDPVSIEDLENNEIGESEEVDELQEKARKKWQKKFEKWHFQYASDPEVEAKAYRDEQQKLFNKNKEELLKKVAKNPTADLYFQLAENERTQPDIDFDQINNYFEQGLELDPNHIGILIQYADDCEYTNPPKSIELYTKLIKIHDEPIQFYANIANAYQQANKRLKALAWYVKDVIEAPNDHGGYSQGYIVDICEKLKSKDAITVLEDILKQRESAATREALYKLYFRKKDYDKAVENVLKYIDISGEPAIYQGERFYKKGLYREALPIFGKSLEQQDSDGQKLQTHFYIGLCHAAMNDFEKSLIEFQKAYKINTSIEKLYPIIFICGAQLLSQKKWDKALEAFNIIKNHDYKKANTQFLLGYIHDQKGDLKTALPYYEKAVELEPKNENYRSALERLKDKNKGFFGNLFGKK